MYIRLARNNEPLIHDPKDKIEIGKAFVLEKGDDFEILTTGTIAYRVRQWLTTFRKQSLSVGIDVFATIKPLDADFLDNLIGTKKKILIVEEHNYIGGFGESILAYMGKRNARNMVKHFAVGDVYSHYVGSQNFILDKFGLYQAPDLKALFHDSLSP
jgi:transketolase